MKRIGELFVGWGPLLVSGAVLAVFLVTVIGRLGKEPDGAAAGAFAVITAGAVFARIFEGVKSIRAKSQGLFIIGKCHSAPSAQNLKSLGLGSSMKKGMQARTLDPSATLRVKMKRPWAKSFVIRLNVMAAAWSGYSTAVTWLLSEAAQAVSILYWVIVLSATVAGLFASFAVFSISTDDD